jgi:hypothetical protein
MDIVERLNDPEMYVDAVDDAIREIETLRERVAELEARLTKCEVDGDYWCCKKCNSFCSVNFDTCGLCKSPRG